MRKFLGAIAVTVTGLASSVVAVTVVLPAAPAAACDGSFCAGGDITDAGLLAETRRQMDDLRQGYGGNAVPDCNDEHDFASDDGNDVVEADGYLRWVPDFANDPTPPDNGAGEWYRQVCYIPGRPTFPTDPAGAAWRRFDAVTPQNLALVAIDDMISEIGDPDLETNPEVESLVGLHTWFWVDGSSLAAREATASVPGITVVATATPSSIRFQFGDGTGMECPGGGTPWTPGTPEGPSDCSHVYETAGVYAVTAGVLWTGTYSVNGGPPTPIGSSIVRDNALDLTVVEAQALNTNG